MLSGVSITCFTASYVLALVLEVTRLLFRSGIRGAVLLGFACAGLFAHTVYLLNRALAGGALPLSSQQDWYLVAAWLVICAGASMFYRPVCGGRKVAYLTVASFAFLLFALGAGLFANSRHGSPRPTNDRSQEVSNLTSSNTRFAGLPAENGLPIVTRSVSEELAILAHASGYFNPARFPIVAREGLA